MTNYTQISKTLNKLTADWFEAHPEMPTIISRLGKIDLPTGININSKFVEFDMLLSTGQVLASDEFNLLGGTEAISKAGRAKTKIFDWKINLKKRHYMAAINSPESSEGKRLAHLLKANTGAHKKKIDVWCTTGPTLANDADYDDDWRTPLKLRNTTSETVGDPQDMNATPGTAGALGTINFTGAGISTNAIASTFALDLAAFASKFDDYSDRSLLKNDGTDTFTVFLNPAFKVVLEQNLVYDGSNYLPITFAEQLKKSNIELIGSQRQTWTGAVDATTTYIIVPNLSENIFWAWLPGAEYKIDPWDVSRVDAFLRGWGIGVCIPKPYSFDQGSTIEKAVRHNVVTPIGA